MDISNLGPTTFHLPHGEVLGELVQFRWADQGASELCHQQLSDRTD